MTLKEAKVVHERCEDALHGSEHGAEAQVEQHQEEERGPEGAGREQSHHLREGDKRQARAFHTLQEDTREQEASTCRQHVAFGGLTVNTWLRVLTPARREACFTQINTDITYTSLFIWFPWTTFISTGAPCRATHVGPQQWEPQHPAHMLLLLNVHEGILQFSLSKQDKTKCYVVFWKETP